MLNKNEYSINNKLNITGFQRPVRRFDLWGCLGFDQSDRDDSRLSNSFYRDYGFWLAGSSNLSSFSIFLISGLLPWLAFSSTVLRTSSSFLDKKSIITKIRVNLSFFFAYIAVRVFNSNISMYFYINLHIFCMSNFL